MSQYHQQNRLPLTIPWGHIGWAVLLNVVFMAIAGFIFGTMLMQTKKRGLLTKFATQ